MSSKPFYLVVGWRFPSVERSVVAFAEPKSSTPGKDVERAPGLRCSQITVKLQEGKGYDEQTRRYIEWSERVTSPHTNYEPPAGPGPTTCNIVGEAPEGRSPNGALFFSSRFLKDGSTTPGDDVERALKAGSTSVDVVVTQWGTILSP